MEAHEMQKAEQQQEEMPLILPKKRSSKVSPKKQMNNIMRSDDKSISVSPKRNSPRKKQEVDAKPYSAHTAR